MCLVSSISLNLSLESKAPFRMRASSSPINFTNNKLYGPFEGGESVTFEWSYTNVSGNNYSTVNDYFIVNCPSYSASPLLSKRVGRHALNNGDSVNLSYTYTIPSARFNTESGLIIKIGVQYSGSYLVLLEKTIKPIESNNINPLSYRSSSYLIKDRSFFINEKAVEESLLFDEYNDYVECDEYNRLLFNKLTFLYQYPHSLSYKEALIKFIDRDNLFTSINKDGDGYTFLAIDLVEKEGRVSIEIPSVYYDPLTLVSNDKKEGTRSNYLYVPKGKSQLLKDYEFIIEVSDVGINKTSFSHYLETEISPFFLGSCIDADYCIVGGIKE